VGWRQRRAGRAPARLYLGLLAIALATTTLATATLASGCGGSAAKPQVLRIATGSTGAVYYRYGQALAAIINRELPGVRAIALPTAASAVNVEMLKHGQAEVAFTQADILNADRDAGLAALARVYDDELHLVVPKDSPIRTLKDLRGHKVSVGASGSGTEVTAKRLLSVAGLLEGNAIAKEQFGLDASTAALRSGRIDAFFFSGGLPVEAIAELARQGLIRLVDLSGLVPNMRTLSDVYNERGVPASVYPGIPSVSTIGDPNYLLVSRSLPDQIAYDITRILIQRREELGKAHPAAEWLDSRTAINTTPLPLHPGAIRFYRDTKE
jgi:TRAP transporter TAXI family solute receptor